MTTWKQPEYERVMEELRRAEDKERAGRKKETMVTKTMTSDPDFLTEKEMNSVSSVYRKVLSRIVYQIPLFGLYIQLHQKVKIICENT